MNDIIETESLVQLNMDEGVFMGLQKSNAFKYFEMLIRLELAELGTVNGSDYDVVMSGSKVKVETDVSFSNYSVVSDGDVLHTTVSDENGVVTFTTDGLPNDLISVIDTTGSIVTEFTLVSFDELSLDDVNEEIVATIEETIEMSEDATLNPVAGNEMYYEDETPELIKSVLNEFVYANPVEIDGSGITEDDV